MADSQVLKSMKRALYEEALGKLKAAQQCFWGSQTDSEYEELETLVENLKHHIDEF